MTTSADTSLRTRQFPESLAFVVGVLACCAYLFLVNFNIPGSMDWMTASGSASVNRALTRHFASALNDAGIVSVTPPVLNTKAGLALLSESGDTTVEYRDRQGRLQTATLAHSAGVASDWLRVRDGKVRYWTDAWPHHEPGETKRMALYKQASQMIGAAIDAVHARERALAQWHGVEGAPAHGQ